MLELIFHYRRLSEGIITSRWRCIVLIDLKIIGITAVSLSSHGQKLSLLSHSWFHFIEGWDCILVDVVFILSLNVSIRILTIFLCHLFYVEDTNVNQNQNNQPIFRKQWWKYCLLIHRTTGLLLHWKFWIIFSFFLCRKFSITRITAKVQVIKELPLLSETPMLKREVENMLYKRLLVYASCFCIILLFIIFSILFYFNVLYFILFYFTLFHDDLLLMFYFLRFFLNYLLYLTVNYILLLHSLIWPGIIVLIIFC